jgi:hypothetical protein
MYGNSANGIADLVGQLFGAWFLLTLLTWWARKSTYTAAIVLALSALSVGVTNFAKLQNAIAARDAKAALQGIADPKNIDIALSKNPSNKLLQFMAAVNKSAQDTDALVTKLSDQIEPPSLSKDIDLAVASRKDLEELRSDAKAAADNVTAFMPRYLALQKAERDKVEAFAASIYMENNMIREGLVGIDKRHAKAAAFSAKVMQVRTEFYRAYESYLAFLLGEYGKYNVVNGQVSFPRQPTVDRYNAVSSALNAAAKGVSDLEVQRKLLIQAQQQEWGRFVKEN